MFLEEYGNLWDLPAQAVCITTNGTVKRDRRAVMGRGCAKEADDRFHLARALGHYLEQRGNHVHALSNVTQISGQPTDWWIVTFPVKHEWHQKADLKLIEQSCQELMQLIEERGWRRVLLPRPGCGNGQLDWEREVKLVIAPLLDERVVIVTFKEDA